MVLGAARRWVGRGSCRSGGGHSGSAPTAPSVSGTVAMPWAEQAAVAGRSSCSGTAEGARYSRRAHEVVQAGVVVDARYPNLAQSKELDGGLGTLRWEHHRESIRAGTAPPNVGNGTHGPQAYWIPSAVCSTLGVATCSSQPPQGAGQREVGVERQHSDRVDLAVSGLPRLQPPVVRVQVGGAGHAPAGSASSASRWPRSPHTSHARCSGGRPSRRRRAPALVAPCSGSSPAAHRYGSNRCRSGVPRRPLPQLDQPSPSVWRSPSRRR